MEGVLFETLGLRLHRLEFRAGLGQGRPTIQGKWLKGLRVSGLRSQALHGRNGATEYVCIQSKHFHRQGLNTKLPGSRGSSNNSNQTRKAQQLP